MPCRLSSSTAWASSLAPTSTTMVSTPGAQRRLDRLLAVRADVREPHAVGRQQRRERMDQHGGHAERVGDQAGVLAAGAAEAIERVAGDVVAALHRDLLDRIRHVLDRDAQKAVRDLLRPSDRRPPPSPAPRIFSPRPRRRAAGPAPAQKSSERNPGSACRPSHWHRSPTAGRRGGSRPAPDRRRQESGPTRKRAPSKCRIEPPPAATVWMSIIGARMRTPATSVSNVRSYVAGEMRHVGGGAPHVEADQALEARRAAALDHPDHAARRPRQDRVLALEQLGCRQAAGRGHEHEARRL